MPRYPLSAIGAGLREDTPAARPFLQTPCDRCGRPIGQRPPQSRYCVACSGPDTRRAQIDLSELERRVDRLERENQRLKLALLRHAGAVCRTCESVLDPLLPDERKLPYWSADERGQWLHDCAAQSLGGLDHPELITER